MTIPTEGDDILIGNDSINGIDALGGNDQIYGFGGHDTLTGGGGNDILFGGRGNDFLIGGTGIDTAHYKDTTEGIRADLELGKVYLSYGGTSEIDGLDAIENVTGGNGSDWIGGDFLDNRLRGRDDGDVLLGRAGDDTLFGDDGEDQLSGGNGDDMLLGGDGTDHLIGGSGADQLRGQGGSDLVLYNVYSGAINIDLLAGTGSGGDAEGDTFSGIENIYATFYNDTLRGDRQDNTLTGRLGQDSLWGREGEDTLIGDTDEDVLSGGADDDFLAGGTEGDIMTGGTGSDTFSYANSEASGVLAGERDLITDFTIGEDVIDISDLDGNALLSGDQAYTFIGPVGFHANRGELRFFFSGGNTIVEGDEDGDRVADFQIEFTGTLYFSASDFNL